MKCNNITRRLCIRVFKCIDYGNSLIGIGRTYRKHDGHTDGLTVISEGVGIMGVACQFKLRRNFALCRKIPCRNISLCNICIRLVILHGIFHTDMILRSRNRHFCFFGYDIFFTPFLTGSRIFLLSTYFCIVADLSTIIRLGIFKSTSDIDKCLSARHGNICCRDT